MASHLSARGRGKKSKVKKPEAERRRRARMALAVERLRVLLMKEGAAAPPLPAPCTPPHLHHLVHAPRRGVWQRLEKVVVLELTVAHLRRLAAHHPGDGGRQQFREGYQRCQEEVMRFLGRTAAVQPHAAARLWQQLQLTSLGAAPLNIHSLIGLDTDPAPGDGAQGHNGADPLRFAMGERASQPRLDSQETVVPVPRGPCVPDRNHSPHMPYAQMHWKKGLRPQARTCFWRPW